MMNLYAFSSFSMFSFLLLTFSYCDIPIDLTPSLNTFSTELKNIFTPAPVTDLLCKSRDKSFKQNEK